MKLITPPKNAKIYRVTERNEFKECRRRWYYDYEEGITSINRNAKALNLGSALHEAWQAYYAGNQDESAAWTVWATKSADLELDQQALGAGMLDHYFKHYLEIDRNVKPVLVEKRLYAKVPHTANCYLTGKVDLLAEIDGKLTIIDHKSFSTFLPSEIMEFADQLTAYLWLLRENGFQVPEAMYNMCKKSVPTIPALLKAGGISKNAAIVTTREVYEQAVIDAGLDLADYQDFLDNTMKKVEFFRREKLIRSKSALDNFAKNLTAEIREMSSKKTELYPHANEWCAWCDFRQLCRIQNEDGDVNYVKRLEYRKNTEREDVYPHD